MGATVTLPLISCPIFLPWLRSSRQVNLCRSTAPGPGRESETSGTRLTALSHSRSSSLFRPGLQVRKPAVVRSTSPTRSALTASRGANTFSLEASEAISRPLPPTLGRRFSHDTSGLAYRAKPRQRFSQMRESQRVPGPGGGLAARSKSLLDGAGAFAVAHLPLWCPELAGRAWPRLIFHLSIP